MSLRYLHFNSLYIVPKDNFVEEALIPALRCAQSLDCMFGFFNSQALSTIAPGLAHYLESDNAPMRLIASPYISERDALAMRDGMSTPAEMLEGQLSHLLGEARLSASALVKHTLMCLSYMLAHNLLHIRLAWMPEGGMFHPKVWILGDGRHTVTFHGSGNMTNPGLAGNHENIRVDASWWEGERAGETIAKFSNEFEDVWIGTTEHVHSLDLSQAMKHNLIKEYAPERPPTLRDFQDAWEADGGKVIDLNNREEWTSKPKLSVPSHFNVHSGAFAHQGKAVEAWEQAGRRGILSMATGSGKTVAALVAATRLHQEVDRLLVVIAAPFKPLVQQWIDEVREFGIRPPPMKLTKAKKIQELRFAVDRLRLAVSSVEVQVVTNDFLVSDDFRNVFDEVSGSVKTLLIGDEVHNLGRKKFLMHPPERFDYRLGLSATPERQYDPEGTEALFSFFGSPVYEFSLGAAIGVCLVPYAYHVHSVDLTEEEFEKWERLTDGLHSLGIDDDRDPGDSGELSEKIIKLLVSRRRIIESAENKIDALRGILEERPRESIKHTLVFVTDKNRAQLNAVNQMLLRDLNLTIHEFTAKQTSKRTEAARIMEGFEAGDYRILTCMRVLDEGVDVPQIGEAFLMASNTVRRQWTQRRGRVLRLCDAINKEMAHIHDFIVVPPDMTAPGAKRILKSELERACEFASLARNTGASDGPDKRIDNLMRMTFR